MMRTSASVTFSRGSFPSSRISITASAPFLGPTASPGSALPRQMSPFGRSFIGLAASQEDLHSRPNGNAPRGRTGKPSSRCFERLGRDPLRTQPLL